MRGGREKEICREEGRWESEEKKNRREGRKGRKGKWDDNQI